MTAKITKYNVARNKVQGMIKKKQKNFIAEKLNQNIGKPKELWKSLKSLGLPSKQQSSSTICLEKDGILSFDHKANAEIFKDFYSNLASDLGKKLPNPLNKFGTGTVREYYKNLNLEDFFLLLNLAFEPFEPFDGRPKDFKDFQSSLGLPIFWFCL